MQQHGANELKAGLQEPCKCFVAEGAMLNSLHMQAPATTSIARRQLLTAVGTAVLALSTAQWPALAAGSTVFVAGSTGDWPLLNMMF